MAAIVASYEQLALPIFRKSVAENDPSTIHAVFAFAGTVVPYVLGSCSFQDKGRLPGSDDDKPHWFFALRGLMSLLRSNFSVLTMGPFGPVLDRGTLPLQYTESDNVHLAKLEAYVDDAPGQLSVSTKRNMPKMRYHAVSFATKRQKELRARIKAPSWLLFINTLDVCFSRGSPGWKFSMNAYRVVSEDSELYECIARGNLTRL